MFRKNGLAKFHFFKFYNKPSKCSSSKSFLNLGLCKFQKFVKKFLNIQSMIVDRRKDKNEKSWQFIIKILKQEGVLEAFIDF